MRAGGGAVGMVLAFALACSGCGASGNSGGQSPVTSAPVISSPPPSLTASPSLSSPPATPCADRVLSGMSLAQRVGQLFALGLAADRLGPSTTAAIRADHLGSVWFVEKSSAGTAGILRVAEAVQSLATTEATDGVRFYVAANQEGGIIQSLTGPGFSTMPSALGQGAVTPSVLRADATVWGRQLRAAGINLDFAPVMDVVPPGADATNQPIGVLKREYGHDPTKVAEHGVAFQDGMAEAGVATTAKHFPGLGRVAGNTDFAAGVVDRVTTLDDPYVQSFTASVSAHVPFVMVALATYRKIDPNHLAVFSPVVIGQMLRGRLHFQGVVISDDMGAATAVASIPPGQRAVEFLLAGGNMIISKTVTPAGAMYRAVLSRATADPAFRQLVDTSALRVLRAKQASGLLPCR
jgi:beta-N-acetylhexosaminidase